METQRPSSNSAPTFTPPISDSHKIVSAAYKELIESQEHAISLIEKCALIFSRFPRYTHTHTHTHSLSLSLSDQSNRKRENTRQRELLRQEAHSLSKILHTSLQIKLEKATKTYCEEWCNALAQTLLATFPREIRDLIFGHLTAQSMPIEIESRFEYNLWAPKTPKSYPSRAERLADYCHPFVLPAYFGPSLHLEIAQAFYEGNRFHLVDIEDLEEFLTYDVFNLDLQPRRFVRKLSIDCSTFQFLRDRSLDREGRTLGSMDNTGASSELRSLENQDIIGSDGLTCLDGSGKSLEITLCVASGTKHVQHDSLVNIGSMVYRYRAKGIMVRVVQGQILIEKGKKGKKQLGLEYYQWPGTDWTFLFDCTKEEFYDRAAKMGLYKST
ncbi:hypothetical protein B0J11DRAFT_68794 [Dendryphion nanum]|uniref:Uncharacterized protein n=1 Tax=Dendryphion nanum TaxID=256645 RepID=A0A9P9DIV4_9PLEO|nr:hypothetical protein B0J11DRAFT_68794 [Dendryphion nanum]